MVDSNLTGIIIVGMIAMVPITIVTVSSLTKMKLKVEQIRADAMVRAEEIKARNQLEIEKLLYEHPGSMCSKRRDTANGSTNTVNGSTYFESGDSRQVREKENSR